MSIHKHLHTIFEKGLDSHIYPGYSAAIVTPDGTVFLAGGRQTYESTSPQITENTLYDVASLTKIIAPMSLTMKLIDNGKMSVDDNVGKYLPDFVTNEKKAEVTVKHLLTYTVDYDFHKGAKALMKEVSPEELAHRMITLPLKSMPGTSYLYSNITAFLLAQLIEKATGNNFYSLVREEIFAPLKMPSATFFPEKEFWSVIPPTEITEERGLVQGSVHDESTSYLQTKHISSGAAGLFASAHDVSLFLKMVIERGEVNNKPFFSRAMVEQWTTNQFPGLLPTLTPLAWGDSNNEMIVEHSKRFVVKGGFTGCFMIGDLEKKVGVVILSNATYPIRPKERTAFNEIKKEILSELLG